MVEHGVHVVDDFEQVRNASLLDPALCTPGIEAKFRKMIREAEE